MIDEVEKKIASNHQEVISAIKALNPAIRETLDDVSVIQQSYMRDVVATLDSSIDELKKRFTQLENRKRSPNVDVLAQILQLNSAIFAMIQDTE